MTAALIKGAPHPEAARKLLDALSSEEIENLITTQMPGVYPTRKVAKTEDKPDALRALAQTSFNRRPSDIAQWPASWDATREPLATTLLSD
jgi:ABC-type Fe3+ transport system substrate-binding protein